MPITFEEQKRLIRYIINLECSFDPAWDAIQAHSDYINQRISKCYNEHKTAETVLVAELSKHLFSFFVFQLINFLA